MVVEQPERLGGVAPGVAELAELEGAQRLTALHERDSLGLADLLDPKELRRGKVTQRLEHRGIVDIEVAIARRVAPERHITHVPDTGIDIQAERPRDLVPNKKRDLCHLGDVQVVPPLGDRRVIDQPVQHFAPCGADENELRETFYLCVVAGPVRRFIPEE